MGFDAMALNRILKAIAAAFIVSATPMTVSAEPSYRATGAFEGSFCRFMVCKLRPVLALSRNGGQPEAIPEHYARVSEFDEKRGLCWLRTDKSGLRFHGRDEKGAMADLGEPEFVVFPCVRR